MRWTGELKLLIGLVVAFLLLFAVSVASYISTNANIATSRTVEQSIQFTGGIESLFDLAKRLDTSSTDFATTGSRESLDKFKAAQNLITPRLASTKDVFLTDARRLKFIEQLEQSIGSLYRADEMLVHAKQEGSEEHIQAALYAYKEIDIPRQIRGTIDSMEDAERELLHRQIVEYYASTHSAILTNLALSFLLMLFLLLLGGTTYRYILFVRKELEADKRVLRAIVEHAPIGILTLSSDLIINEVNPAFCFNTARQPESILNKKVTEVIPELPKTAFLEATEKGTAHQVEQLLVNLGRGDPESERYWDITVWPIRETGIIKRMILLTVDVTEKVNLSNQREVFAQTLTHDMKTPLIAADRIYEAILDSRVGNMDPTLHGLIEKLRKNNLDILKMVKDVLEVSRYKQHSLVLNMESMDVKPAIDEAVAKLASTAEHRAVEISIDTADSLPPIWADQIAIYHLVANLLENAIKFSPSEGVVRIRTEAKDSRVFLHVEDSGPGMSEEEQKKLFKSSWQGELGKTAPSGTGLGLYLCQQIVKAHRGEITCKSILGQGTTFTVDMPQAPQTVQEESVKADTKETEVVLGL